MIQNHLSFYTASNINFLCLSNHSHQQQQWAFNWKFELHTSTRNCMCCRRVCTLCMCNILIRIGWEYFSIKKHLGPDGKKPWGYYVYCFIVAIVRQIARMCSKFYILLFSIHIHTYVCMHYCRVSFRFHLSKSPSLKRVSNAPVCATIAPNT